MDAVADVLTRYDELAALLASIDERPIGDDEAARRAAVVLHREARLLDARRLDALARHVHRRRRRCGCRWRRTPIPATDQSLVPGRPPPPRRARGVARRPDGVGPAPGVDDRAQHRHASRRGPRRRRVDRPLDVHDARAAQGPTSSSLAGRQVHELVGPDLRCRSKILVVPQLADGLRNPSFLL